MAIVNAVGVTRISLHVPTLIWVHNKAMLAAMPRAAAMAASLTPCAPAWTAWLTVAVAAASVATEAALAVAITTAAETVVALAAVTAVKP